MIRKNELMNLYFGQGLSMKQIAGVLSVSHHKVAYWMNKYEIKRRSRSQALTKKYYPQGDPFSLKKISTLDEAYLLGLGMGLYWGEGTKANTHQIRLGNTDPGIILHFMKFLQDIYGVSKDRFRFGLQLFTDIQQEKALSYWIGILGVSRSQFYKSHITISDSIGTYRRKSQYGVVTIYFNNKRLRDILVNALPR